MPGFNGLTKGTRRELPNRPRKRGTLSPQYAIAGFEGNQKVHLSLDSSVHEDRFHPRLNGLTGEVTGKQGRVFKVRINDGGKEKTVIVRPAHPHARQQAMTIFREKLDEEYLTTSEVKELLVEVKAEYAANEEREVHYGSARAIEHVNRLAHLDPEESCELAEELAGLEKVDSLIAIKIADLLPQSRDELRAVLAQQRYALPGDELGEILNVIAEYV